MRDNQCRRPSEEEIAAARAAKQAERGNNPEAIAWRQALEIYPHLVNAEYGRRSIFTSTHNPDNGTAIQRVVQAAILEGKPIPAFAFWGAGPKFAPDHHDQASMDLISVWTGQVQAVYSPGISLTFIIADVHAAFNGLDSYAASYHPQIRDLLNQRGWGTISLQSIYDQFNLRLPNPYEPIDHSSRAFQTVIRYPNLIQAAERHYPGEDPQVGAYQYAQIRLQEVEPLLSTFSNHLMLAHARKDGSLQILPQNMPILFVNDYPPAWFRNGHHI